MGVGMSGLVSGLDTDTIVKAMVSGYTNKKDNLTKAQTKLQWKMDAWKEMNKKVYSFYSGKLSNMRFGTNYTKKTTSISDSTVAKITASGSSVNGTQSLAVAQLAKSGYMTGAKINADDPSKKYTSSTKLSELGVTDDSTIVIATGDKQKSITVGKDTSIASFVAQLKNAGVNANFDEANQRFFISSKESGADNDFSLTAETAAGNDALAKLGLVAKATSLADIEKSSEFRNYSAWAAYDTTKLDSIKKSEIDSQYAGKKYTTDKMKSELEGNVKKLEAENTLIYQAKFLTELKDSGKTASDDIKAEIDSYKSGLSGAELDAINAVEASLKNSEGNYDADKVEEAFTKVQTALTINPADYASQLAENDAKIAGFNNIIENDTLLQNEVTTKNNQIMNEVTASVNASVDNRSAIAKAYMAQYNYEKELSNANGVVSNVDPDTVAAYNTSKTSYGDLLGLTDSADTSGDAAVRIYGQNAVIYLNGAKFENNDNTITVNGLSITATETTGVNSDGSYKTVSITTTDDTDAIYDMIRDFISEYNTLINEMDSQYNAASSKGFEPLTDDQKEQMSEDEVEKWEKKIKDSLLRKDSTLNGVAQSMKNTMQKGIQIGNKKYFLSDFGIGTQSYFSAAANEKSALHIDGDEDDTVTAGKTDKLKAMILTDPDTVVSFFSELSSNLYGELTKKMQSTSLSSTYTLYNDKQMQSEYSQYNTKISKQEEYIKYWEDYYYNQFTAMESALSKLNSQQSSLSGLFSR